VSESVELSSPEAAEAAFYAAFEARDLEAMMAVWAEDDSVVCIHPGAERLAGRAAVEEGWRQIFAAETLLGFRVAGLRRQLGVDLAVHSLEEHLYVGGQLRGVVLACNAYRLIDGLWRMVLHHSAPGSGSIAPRDSGRAVH
jgi:ketosteroid isomerase-like protein